MAGRPTVAYQGAPGAFSHEACLRLLPHDEPVAFPQFADAIAAVISGECECALLPVRNNTAGEVPGVSKLIEDAGLHICADAWLPISHQLLANAGVTLGSLKTASSHPMALAQCAKTLKRLRLKPVEAFDTAGAAQQLAQNEDQTSAVIASRTAGEIYGLEIVAPNIEDDPGNATLFAIVSREPRPQGE
jgi:prephenate dehydratase